MLVSSSGGAGKSTVAASVAAWAREQLEQVADDTAAQEALLKAEKINEVVDKLEERYNRPEVVVQDLVASFLLPEVDRQLVREEVAVDQAKVSLGVRDALRVATEEVCQEVPSPEDLQQ